MLEPLELELHEAGSRPAWVLEMELGSGNGTGVWKQNWGPLREQ